MDTSLERVDEFMHISRRMRRIALQSAVGGMTVSMLGMLIAAAGYLPPVAGAILQEVIDIVVVANAVRCSAAEDAERFLMQRAHCVASFLSDCVLGICSAGTSFILRSAYST